MTLLGSLACESVDWDNPDIRLTGAFLDKWSFSALQSDKSSIRARFLNSTFEDQLPQAQEFSHQSITEMEKYISRIVFEVGRHFADEITSFSWLGTYSEIKARGDATASVPVGIETQWEMLDRAYISLAMPGDYLTGIQSEFGSMLDTYFSSKFDGEDYPQTDELFGSLHNFGSTQSESVALWLSLTTLQVISKIVKSERCADWACEVLCSVEGRIRNAILSAKNS